MSSDPKKVKKPYTPPSLTTLDASAAKAKLASGNPRDPNVLKMLSFIDGNRKKKKVSHTRSLENDLTEE
jgi:hypothetical protein